MQSADILSAATNLARELKTRGDDIESERTLPGDVVQKLKDAGCFRMAMPVSWGGPEMSSLEQHQVIYALAQADASVAWCVMIGLDSGIFSGYLEEATARSLYGALDVVQAGWLYPMGQAHRVKGGYEVTGRWRFGSGCKHCDVLDGGCTVFEDGAPVIKDGAPEWRVVLAPRDSYEILDTWYTTGLAGSGSNDYTVTRLFVPESHSFSFAEPKREGTLWSAPDTILRKMSAVPLGVARGALDIVYGVLEDKVDKPTGSLLKENPRIQAIMADLEGRFGSARAYVEETLEAQWSVLASGARFSTTLRAQAWLSRMRAFQESRTVVRELYDLMGAGSVYVNESPLDRLNRDLQTICQHMVGQTKELERVGEMLLTGKSQNLML